MPPALPLEIDPEALEEARAAREWYLARSARAALNFMKELDAAVDQVAQFPHRWPSHLHGTRRYRFRRFPFSLVYEILPERIRIIACQHARRRPGYWRDRLS